MDVNFKELAIQLRTMVVFRRLAEGEVLLRLDDLFHAPAGDAEARVAAYREFICALYRHGWDLSRYLLEAAAADENDYIRRVARGEEIPPLLAECVERELMVLGRLAQLDAAALCAATGYEGALPGFSTTAMDFPAEYRARVADVTRRGYGIFAGNVMFRLEGGEIVPVGAADGIRVEQLIGYEVQRREILDNTRALAQGLPAANVLLCGDAGTGKSSTVKAAANLFADQGVRLLELRKEQLREIPRIMERLQGNPLKFILFLDDLSFQTNDDDFNSLKAMLEGSSCTRASNVVVYATSNRRHLVKESFSDRERGDDVHLRDTIQELLSLSERFGLTVLFISPDRRRYLEIVRGLAQQQGLDLPAEELERRAELFALEKGGRSPRAAVQFIHSLLAVPTQEVQSHADS